MLIDFSMLLLFRRTQYLDENVHKTYVDVDEMTQSLMSRYQEYSRRKLIPFRILVVHGKFWNFDNNYAVERKSVSIHTAYKTVLHSYGLDSNPGSEIEDAGSDLEVMDVSYTKLKGADQIK